MSRKRKTVYLSGGMQFARGNGSAWRDEFTVWCKQALGHRVLDPVAESERLQRRMRSSGVHLRGGTRTGPAWNRFLRRVVDQDSGFVLHRADYIVCLWNSSARRGAGTQGELTLARLVRKPVYLVSRSDPARIPGWVRGCMTRQFRSFRDLKDFLVRKHPADSAEKTSPQRSRA